MLAGSTQAAHFKDEACDHRHPPHHDRSVPRTRLQAVPAPRPPAAGDRNTIVSVKLWYILEQVKMGMTRHRAGCRDNRHWTSEYAANHKVNGIPRDHIRLLHGIIKSLLMVLIKSDFLTLLGKSVMGFTNSSAYHAT
jgi:hypothetical protein